MANKKNILIVDDDNSTRELLKSFFEENNFNTIEADNGRQALDLLKKNPPDIVLTDLLLPGEHGIELINSIKKECSIPVIVISGIYTNNDISRSIGDILIDGYFKKPVNLEKLLNHVIELLNV